MAKTTVGEVSIEIEGMDQLMKKLDMLPDEIAKECNAAVLGGGRDVQADARRGASRGKTGWLANHIDMVVQSVGKFVLWVSVGTNVIYAKIQELGGTVRPKTAQALTIPFPGVTGSARDYQNTFILPKKGIIVQDVGSKRLRALFKLVKSVEIPARPYLGPALTKNADSIREKVAAAVKRACEYVAGS